jgi:hypothetical protein
MPSVAGIRGNKVVLLAKNQKPIVQSKCKANERHRLNPAREAVPHRYIKPMKDPTNHF